MPSVQYDRVLGGKKERDDEDELVDEWGVRYEGHHKPGGGLFSSKKRHSRRKYFLVGAATVILVMFIVIIIVAIQKHTDKPEHRMFEKWINKTEGLIFYPVPSDGSVLITYTEIAHANEGGYGPLIYTMNEILFDYASAQQQSDIYVDCNKTYAPMDKICRFDTSVFKDCTRFNEYGYSSGRPCVLLQLNLAINHTAQPFGNDTEVQDLLKERYSPDHIGVSCEGSTEADRINMYQSKVFNPAIQYFPSKGFPANWYRPRTINRILSPIIMVKFNDIIDYEYVRINCTAWAQNFNDGSPQNSSIYSTSFVIYQN